MTYMEILKGKELMAQFMGYEIHGYENGDITVKNPDANIIVWCPEYESDWNHLMQVIDRIESLRLGNLTIGSDEYFDCSVEVVIASSMCEINLYGAMRSYKGLISIRLQDLKYDAVFIACVEFIKWYNLNK